MKIIYLLKFKLNNMKYYKLINDPERVWKSFEIGKIYPETFIASGKSLEKNYIVENKGWTTKL